MSLDKEALTKLVDDLSLLDDISVSNIPDLDLYMDQITTFFDDNLKHLKRDENDKILTKTMINNYSKCGLLMPPVNKKYSKQHIILLILIYNMKQILSINDIKTLLSPILNNFADSNDDVMALDDIYNTFLEMKQKEFDSYCDVFSDKFELIRNKTAEISNNDKDLAELFLTVLMLVAHADSQKRLAEKIIDEYFKKDNKNKGDC